MIRKYFVTGVLLLAIVLAVWIALPAHNTVSAQGATEVTRFVSNGDWGWVLWSDSSMSADVYVVRGGSTQSPETNLSLNLNIYNPCCYSYTGWQQIANSDLQGSSEGSLQLTTDISNNPNIVLPPGYPGVISLTWKKIQGVRVRQTGTQQMFYRDRIEFRNGTSEYSTSSADGTILGVKVSNAGPYMGTDHKVEHTIQRGTKP
jgi:hypothetical protein